MANENQYTITATKGSVTGDVTSVDPLEVKESAINDAAGFDDAEYAEKSATAIKSANIGSNPAVVPPRG